MLASHSGVFGEICIQIFCPFLEFHFDLSSILFYFIFFNEDLESDAYVFD